MEKTPKGFLDDLWLKISLEILKKRSKAFLKMILDRAKSFQARRRFSSSATFQSIFEESAEESQPKSEYLQRGQTSLFWKKKKSMF